MEAVVSKRHPINFYFILLAILLLGIGLALFTISIAIEEKNKPTAMPKHDLLIVLGAGVILYSLYAFYRYVINAPKITLQGKSITFNNTHYLITDIESIAYTGKQPFGALLLPSEGMKITFKNSEVRYVYDTLYSNAKFLKQYIKHALNPDTIFSPVNIEPVKASHEEHYYFYKGNFYFSFRGLSLMALLALSLAVPKTFDSYDFKLLVIPITIIILFSPFFSYFELNRNYFRIRSHLKIWKDTIYNVEDIEEIVMESNGRAPHSLRLILKDYSSKTYSASTLSDCTWKELQEDLEKLNIKVRNEI